MLSASIPHPPPPPHTHLAVAPSAGGGPRAAASSGASVGERRDGWNVPRCHQPPAAAAPMSQPASGAAATWTTLVQEPAATEAFVTAAPAPQHLLVKLRRRVRRVRWAEDVIDNEELCRKKSKCCCIFHRQRPFDEGYESDEPASEANAGREDAQGGAAAAHKRQRTGNLPGSMAGDWLGRDAITMS